MSIFFAESLENVSKLELIPIIMKPFKVLCIGGSDSSGGAGIQADLKAVSACGGYGLSAVTAVTAQNSLGVQGVFPVAPVFVARQLESVLSDIGTDAVKTGMLLTAGIVSVVAAKIREYGIEKVVVDPVMLAKGGRNLLFTKARQTLVKKLLPLAMVVTPNIPEAEELVGMEIKTVSGMKKAAALIQKFGVRNVIIKGGHLPGSKKTGVIDILYDGKKYYEYLATWIDTKDSHGTGCTYASALAANLASGSSIANAANQAKVMVTEAIKNSLSLGKGHGPVNVLADKRRGNECLHDLQEAIKILSANQCGELIPEVQSNLAYAMAGAETGLQVAGFSGRIIRFRDSVRVMSNPEFGASRHIAHIILTVMQYDKSYRSAMNIKYSEKIIHVCRKIGFAVDSFDRSDEPAEKKNKEGFSLEWGVNEVLRRSRVIPDIIYDRGGWGKEPMVRVLGRNPAEVVNKVLTILKKL